MISDTCPTDLYRTPDEADDLRAALVALMAGTAHTWRQMIYTLEDPQLLASCQDMLHRGVDARWLVDSMEASTPAGKRAIAPLYALAGPDRVRVGTSPAGRRYILHDKVCVSDGLVVVDGSLNWTAPAFHEVNQTRVTRSAVMAQAYAATFDALWQWVGTYEADMQKILTG